MADSESDYSLETIEWLLEQKKWEESIDKCHEAVLTVGKDKVDPKYFFYRAKGYYESGDHTECLTDLRSVVYREDISVTLRVDALVLKAECLFVLQEYESCKDTMKVAFSQHGDPNLYNLINKCNEKLGLTTEKPPSKPKPKPAAATDASKDTKETKDTIDTTNTKVDIAEKKAKTFRHEWYQSDTEVVISLLIKKVNREDLVYQFKESHISVEVKLPDDQSYILKTDLFDKIKFYESKVTVLPSKIEIRLMKTSPIQWTKLEKDRSKPDIQSNIKTFSHQDPDAPSQDPQKFPSSAKSPTDWDKLAAEVKKDEADEKPEGDAALNQFFQQIYGQGSDEQKRAMMKSFQESGGTVLSTNWEDVGKDKVEMKHPDGMEFKKYDI